MRAQREEYMSNTVDRDTKLKQISEVLADETRLETAITALELIAAALNKKNGDISAKLNELDRQGEGEWGSGVQEMSKLTGQLLATGHKIDAVMKLLQLLTNRQRNTQEIFSFAMNEINLPPTAIAVLIPSLAGQLEVSTKK